MHSKSAVVTALSLSQLVAGASLWKETTPQTPQPYALKKGRGIPLGSGDTWNTFPITGNSSGKAFTLMNTNGPAASAESMVFPHVHKKTYENFYSAKGRTQLWGQNHNDYLTNSSEQTSRILGPGDFGGIPNNTIHTFQMLEPDTQLTGVLVPGGFEEFFFAQADTFVNNTSGFNFSELPSWDVYPQLDFTPRKDLVNGKAGPGNWYDGVNELPPDNKKPVWVAKNYGPKWLNSEFGYYQIITPLVRGQQTENMFAQGHITMSPKSERARAPQTKSPHATAFQMEEGQLAVTVRGFDTVHLIHGDVVFVPPNTPFTYYAEAEFTKFMYVSGGGDGLDAMLISQAKNWTSAFYPRSGSTNVKRGLKI